MRPVFVLAALLAACDGYDEDLGPAPFLCGPDDACPSGYTCMDDPANGRKVCVGSDDSISGDFNCNDDGQYEPNDMLAMAQMTPVDAMKTFSLDGLAICPAGDKDTYAVMISTSSSNLEATIAYQADGGALRGAILNTGGIPIANASPATGAPTTLHALARNLPTGLYYVQVVAVTGTSPSVNNYTLSIAVTTP